MDQRKTILRNLVIASALLAIQAAPAFALDEIIKNYRGIRSLGMGGVVTTTGVYDEALFGNPAMQMEDPESKLTILGITAEGNTNFMGDVGKIKEVANASGTGVISTIANNHLDGRNEHARLSILAPAYYNPKMFNDTTGFSFGLLINTQLNLMLRANAAVDTQTFVDAGPNLGFGKKLLDGNLDLGVNLHTIYRMSANKSLQATQFLAGSKLSFSSIGDQGFGVDGDLGAFYKLPVSPPFFKALSVGASLNSVLASKYTTALRSLVKTAGGSPTPNDRNFNVGVRGDLPDAWILSNSALAIEMQDIGSHENYVVSTWKRLHIGTETHFLTRYAVRLGLNQGYLGGGLGADFPIVKVDFAAYGEEIGPNTGQLEDIRLAARISFDI